MQRLLLFFKYIVKNFFCIQKFNTSLSPSLCYSAWKKNLLCAYSVSHSWTKYKFEIHVYVQIQRNSSCFFVYRRLLK